jgi:hypothetical protein
MTPNYLSALGGNIIFEYWRSNHRAWKDHKVGKEEEMIVPKESTDPNLH